MKSALKFSLRETFGMQAKATTITLDAILAADPALKKKLARSNASHFRTFCRNCCLFDSS